MEILRGTEATMKEVVTGVHNTKLAEGERMNLLQFEIAPGGSVPRHGHPHEQVGYIVRGRATFITDDDEVILGPGDTYAIAGDEPYALENRTDERVFGVDVFGPARAFAPFVDNGE